MHVRSVAGPNVQESKVGGGRISSQKWSGPVVLMTTSVFPLWSDRLCSTGATNSPWRTIRKEQRESNSNRINRLSNWPHLIYHIVLKIVGLTAWK